ncbi:hypothetical protein [Bradyrhizobium sp. McL0616]|uniref:hypothetical protein n=1 Tax=Bradyrhizobium sp. McL0616 TaxID=3415674 RepID=UPI003CE9A2F6
MRKALVVALIARRLGVRRTRLTSLVQRLSEDGMLPVSSGPPYPDLNHVEAAHVLLAAAVDEGIAAAPDVVEKYGSLLGPTSNLEAAIAHTLARPDSLPPRFTSLELHCDAAPHALLTMMTSDGMRTSVFGDMPETETVDRMVTLSGSALFGIASELAGMSALYVDALLDRNAK